MVYGMAACEYVRKEARRDNDTRERGRIDWFDVRDEIDSHVPACSQE